MTRRTSAKAAPLSGLEVTRTIRRALRNPRALVLLALSRELTNSDLAATQRMVSGDPQLRRAVRAEVELLTGIRRLAVILGSDCFAAEPPGRLKTTAITRYARQVHVSKSTLYAWRELHNHYGILGLCPRWHGGRPGREIAAERALLRDVVRCNRAAGLLGVFRLMCRRAKMTGRHIPESELLREMS